MGARTLSRAGLGAAALVAVLLSAVPAAEAAKTIPSQMPSQWTWKDYAPTLLDVSCSSPGVCLAVGERGRVLHSTGGGRDLAWSSVKDVKSDEELTGVTCTPKFCLAVSNTPLGGPFDSKVYRSTDHGKTWSAGVALPEATGTKPTKSARAIACDPVAHAACYAVGPDGGVWQSDYQGLKWRPLSHLPSASYRRVACPDINTCVAIGKADSALIEGAKVTALKPPAGSSGEMKALACDTRTRCVATDGGSHFMTIDLSERPTEWGPAQPFEGVDPDVPVTSLACPKKDACVGLGQPESFPHAVRTGSLSATPALWHQSPLGTDNLQSISCASTTCVAVGKAGAWFVSINTVDVGDHWIRANEVAPFDTIQCSESFSPTCVAGGMMTIGVSRSKGKRWSLPVSGPTLNIGATGCTGASACLFVGKTLARFYPDVTKPDSYERREPPNPGVEGASPQTCITAVLCVAFGDHVVYTTEDGGKTAWKPTSEHYLLGAAPKVACVPGRTNPPTCVAVGKIGGQDYFAIGTMRDHVWTWNYSRSRPVKEVTAVACSRDGECTAVNAQGEVQKSVSTKFPDEWTKPGELVLPDKPNLTSVACPGDGVCLAGGLSGSDAIIASTTDNWTTVSIDPIPLFSVLAGKTTFTTFGCETTRRCVVVGKEPTMLLVGSRG